jgi:hypothetical protein
MAATAANVLKPNPISSLKKIFASHLGKMIMGFEESEKIGSR